MRALPAVLLLAVVACQPSEPPPPAGELQSDAGTYSADAGSDGSPDAGTLDGGDDAGSPDAGALSTAEATCLDAGWARAEVDAAGLRRKLLWRGPATWSQGAIIVLHGGGGRASDFCSGGPLVQPQIAFTTQAVSRGFAIFVLEATDGVVTDAQGRACGKRFDFSVLPRPNVDLPFIERVGTQFIPSVRPQGSADARFITGLSTGGYMTIRAATAFDGWVTAFAPVSAGDPYGTDTLCDPALSPRDSAVGILVDRETGREITEDGACASDGGMPNESPWDTMNPAQRPGFRQFHHASDGIVDLSCLQKATAQLAAHGYSGAMPAIVPPLASESALLHLWLNVYNQPILDAFDAYTP